MDLQAERVRDQITADIAQEAIQQNARQLISVINGMKLAFSERKLAQAELEKAREKLADVEARIAEFKKRFHELECTIATAAIFSLGGGEKDE